MVVDYEVTKRFLYKKYWNPQWSEADFEDRYHDSLEVLLRYGVPEGVVPLTCMCTIFRTWYSRKQETKRQLKGEELVQYISDEGLEVADTGYELDINSLLLSSYIKKLDLSPYHEAVLLMKLSGYTNREIANEFEVSESRVDEIWRTKVLSPLVTGSDTEVYKKNISLNESKSGRLMMRSKRLAK